MTFSGHLSSPTHIALLDRFDGVGASVGAPETCDPPKRHSVPGTERRLVSVDKIFAYSVPMSLH